MPNRAKPYGLSVHIALHNCNPAMFNRKNIGDYFVDLCHLIDMKRCKRVWWDDVGVPRKYRQTAPHTTGTTAVQFILTSDILIHSLKKLRAVYLDVFSCKLFDPTWVAGFSAAFFEGEIVQCDPLIRP